jgi:hypothetical protein
MKYGLMITLLALSLLIAACSQPVSPADAPTAFLMPLAKALSSRRDA